MKPKYKFLSDEFLNKAIRVLVVVLLSLGVILLASQFSSIWFSIVNAVQKVLVPLALVWLLSLIMFPLIKLLERRGVGPRGLSVTVVFVGTVTAFFLIIYFLLPFVEQQIRDFFANDWPAVQSYFENDFRDDFILGPDLYDWILGTINDSTLVEDTISNFADNLASVVSSSLINIFAVVVVLPVLLIYYLLDFEMINDTIRSIVPKKYEKDASDLGSRLSNTVGAYIRGQLLLMLAIGIAATILYRLIGLQYFFIFGIIVGLTNIIPYFGAIIAMIPVVIYAVITSDTGPGPIVVVLVNVGLQMIEGNIFQPIIMGRQLEMHAIIIIVSILFFGSLFGTIGVIFAAPMAATIRVLIEFYRDKRNTANQQNLDLRKP
ncbi:AI-2E family transporter [Candidatus Xianfuyuplasma coldseepsis]|uniref:AI-2E family transporter n=1 Tax=Candidatus Xianfuyuplasma coldseepsis TaxID=2782163 RepID=A0A7L7KUG6_9MOLU|nr:AI-2E family transporter [Xianfuyuplasma coldseepsis]QMS85886.1 AI-2E family transporter [Xianfuyuplasma coldseepsis]